MRCVAPALASSVFSWLPFNIGAILVFNIRTAMASNLDAQNNGNVSLSWWILLDVGIT
jgi:hypothetical protein